MNLQKKNNVIRLIKNCLISLAIIAAIIIAIEYLTSIQLIWTAIIIVTLLFKYDIDNLRSEIFSTRGKLGDWNVFRSPVDTDEDVKMYKYRNISVRELSANELITRKIEIGDFGMPSLKIINCAGLSYLGFFDEDGTERFVIETGELSDLLMNLKYKNNFTTEDTYKAIKQAPSEKDIISIAIAKREEYLREYREDNAEDFEIEEVEAEILQLKKLLEKA